MNKSLFKMYKAFITRFLIKRVWSNNFYPYSKNYLILCLIFAINTALLGEGTPALAPSVEDEVGLYVGAGNSSGGGEFGIFAWKDSDAKLAFNIEDTCEKVYFGFSIPKTDRRFELISLTEDLIFRIIDPNGNPVSDLSCFGNITLGGSVWQTLTTTDVNITSRSMLDQGITQLGGTGYTAFELDLSACGLSLTGDYAVEFYTRDLPYDPNSANAGFYIEYFDITVADCSNNGLTGRVWSNNWELGIKNDGDGPFDRAFNGAFYVCSADGFISKINFNSGLNNRLEAGKNNDQRSGFRAGSFNVAFNSFGVTNTGNILEDRRSLQDINSPNPEFRVFLNLPDETLCPEQEIGQIQASENFLTGCGLNQCFNIQANKVGQIELLLENRNDANGNLDQANERIITYIVTELDKAATPQSSGFNYIFCVPWDGKDGQGNDINPEIINLKGFYSQGIYHFPVYDVEFNDDGYTVKTVRPNLGPQKLFYDDTLITEDNNTGEPKDGTNGCDAPCHTWTGEYEDFSVNTRSEIYGNFNTINTWWFANTAVRDLNINSSNLLAEVICPSDYFGCPTIDTMITGVPLLTGANNDCSIVFTYTDQITGADECNQVIERSWIASSESMMADSVVCVQLLVLQDTLAPALANCPPDVTIDVDENCEGSLDWTIPAAFDNCPNELIILTSHVPGQKFPIGTTIVNISATDACGNTSSCEFSVTVNNPQLSITCPPDYEGCIGDSLSASLLGIPEVNDANDCPISIRLTFIDMAGSDTIQSPLGQSIKRVWMAYAEDDPSNIVMCIQRIKLEDIVPPVFLNCPPDVTLAGGENCQAQFNWEGPIVIDDCSGIRLTSSHTPDSLFSVGETVVNYTAMDESGNSETCSFTVTIEDCDYCDARATDQTCFWVDQVKLGEIDNTTGKDNGYGNYKELSTDLKIGTKYNITLNPGFPLNHTFDPYWFVWIDYNKDGDFTDQGEQLFTIQSNEAVTVEFTVPLTAKIRKTVMRIALKYTKSTDPCESFVFGEIEDYQVNIISNNGQFIASSPMEDLLIKDNIVPNVTKNNTSSTGRSKIAVAPSSSTQLQLFPNPVNRALTIQLDRPSKTKIHLKIFNELGQKVYEESFQNLVENKVLIPASELEKGMYFLSFQEQGFEPIIRKFTKM